MLDDENIELEAMRALKYEGTPLEIALGLKQDGNELAGLKRWKEAKDVYTQALGVLHKSQRTPTPAESIGISEVATLEQVSSQREKSIEEACYVNRALCNLELSMTPSGDLMGSAITSDLVRELPLHDH